MKRGCHKCTSNPPYIKKNLLRQPLYLLLNSWQQNLKTKLVHTLARFFIDVLQLQHIRLGKTKTEQLLHITTHKRIFPWITFIRSYRFFPRNEILPGFFQFLFGLGPWRTAFDILVLHDKPSCKMLSFHPRLSNQAV